MKGLRLSRQVVLAAAITGTLASAGVASATTITVNTTSDGMVTDGRCSLLEAVSASTHRASRDTCPAGSGADTIVLPSGTITLGSASAIEVWSDQITFQGNGMGKTIIVSSNAADPSFETGLTNSDCDLRQAAMYISTSATVSLNDLTFQGGADTMGVCLSSGTLNVNRTRVTNFQSRGIFAEYSPSSNGGGVFLSLEGALVDNNHCYNDGWGGAGMLYSDFDVPGSFEVHHSTISNNFSEDVGGGISLIGNQFGNRHIGNTTISGNTAVFGGGGLYYAIDSYLQLDSVTIAFNHSFATGGGIFKSSLTGNLLLGSTIVNNNTADGDAQQNNLNVTGNNNSITCTNILMFVTGSEWTSGQFGTLPNGTDCEFGTADAKLGALVGKGGLNNLPVHPLLSGSHAIDPVNGNTFADDDERTLVRPVDGDGNGSKISDRGAYELHPQQLETESLTVVAKSTDTHAVVNDTNYSGNSGTNLQANAANDFVTYRTPTLTSGTYSVSVRYKKASNAGRFQFARADTQTGTYTNLGAVQDAFASTTAWTTVVLGNVTFSSSGQKFLRFTITGKNASSSGFQLFPDYVDLVKQ